MRHGFDRHFLFHRKVLRFVPAFARKSISSGFMIYSGFS